MESYTFTLRTREIRTSRKNNSLGNVPPAAEHALNRLPWKKHVRNPDHRRMRLRIPTHGVDEECDGTFFTSGSELTVPSDLYLNRVFPVLSQHENVEIEIEVFELHPRQPTIEKWEKEHGRSYASFLEERDRKRKAAVAEESERARQRKQEWDEKRDAMRNGGAAPPALPEEVIASTTPAGNDASEDELHDHLGMEGMEGAEVVRQHKARKRDMALVREKKRSVRPLACEICDFDFEKFYDELGQGFIEVHHREPLAHREGPSPTKLDDLMLVCANCHAMIHRHIAREPHAIHQSAPALKLALLRSDEGAP